MKTRVTVTLLGLAGGFLWIHPSGGWAVEGSFINKRKVDGVKISQFTHSQTITADELTMILAADGRLYEVTRATVSDAFAQPTPMTTLNAPGIKLTFPSITDSGLILVFQRSPAGAIHDTDLANDLYQASRSSAGEPFGSAIRLGTNVNVAADLAPHISADGLTLYFTSFRPGGSGGADIWVATRSSVNDPFRPSVNLNNFYPGSTINTASDEYAPSLSRDGLTLFFSDAPWGRLRPGGRGKADLWVSTRPHAQAPFGTPVNLNDLGPRSEVNTSQNQAFPTISPRWPTAGAKLYFASDDGTRDVMNPEIWEATWKPAPGLEIPELAIHSGLVALAWPHQEGFFAIESAPEVNGPWTLLNRPVQEMGGRLESMAPISANQQYFRLTPAQGLPDNLFERRIAGSYLTDFPDGSRLLSNLSLGGATHRETSDDFIGLTGLPDLPFHRYSGGFGNWTRTGPRTIRIVELAFQFGADGLITAIPKIESVLEFGPDLQSATGTASVKVYRPDQDPLTDAPAFPGPTFEGLITRRIR